MVRIVKHSKKSGKNVIKVIDAIFNFSDNNARFTLDAESKVLLSRRYKAPILREDGFVLARGAL